MVLVLRVPAVVRVLQVTPCGPQRLQDHRCVLGRQDGPELVVQVTDPVPGQPALGPGRAAVGLAHPPVGLGETLQLGRGHRRGHRDQVGFGLRGDDPGKCSHLGVGQAGRGELVPDERVLRQGPGHPDLVAGGAGGELALPRQPGRAGRQLPVSPTAALVEVRHQQQELARRGGQVPGQLAQPRFQPLQRLQRRAGGGR